MLISLSYKDKTRQDSKTAIVFSLELTQTGVASEHFFTLVYLSFQLITNLLPPSYHIPNDIFCHILYFL